MNVQSNYLLTSEHMQNEKIVPKWVSEEYHKYREVVMKPTFPCFFGRTGEERGELRYSYISHSDWSHLPHTLSTFLQLVKEPPLVRRGLFIFVEPENKEQPLSYYRNYFWDVLQYLNRHDPKKWPNHTPADPNDFLWSFCFDDESIFAFGNAPAYKQRITRNLGESMVIGIQPRRIFEGLEGTEPNGINSREAVRKRVEAWDKLPKHPDISHYGDPAHHEWKQFFIGDDCEPITSKCPFHAVNTNK
ncbi:YqcI/YcgG family protein [Alkalihalophilus pseudofirmus]|nr:YqcI/YcgG family protein [Alkalihalophilus pseudofirmus]